MKNILQQNRGYLVVGVLMAALLALPSLAHAVVIEENHPDAVEVIKANSGHACVMFLDEYLHPLNSINHEWEVKKLQMFLNAFMNTDLDRTGEFDASTEMAARAFQLQYNDRVLIPWEQTGYTSDIGPFTPTGYVYITTRHMINELLCVNENVLMPSLHPDSNIMNGTIN